MTVNFAPPPPRGWKTHTLLLDQKKIGNLKCCALYPSSICRWQQTVCGGGGGSEPGTGTAQRYSTKSVSIYVAHRAHASMVPFDMNILYCYLSMFPKKKPGTTELIHISTDMLQLGFSGHALDRINMIIMIHWNDLLKANNLNTKGIIKPKKHTQKIIFK